VIFRFVIHDEDGADRRTEALTPGPLSRRSDRGGKKIKRFAPFHKVFAGENTVKSLNLIATQANKPYFNSFMNTIHDHGCSHRRMKMYLSDKSGRKNPS